MKIEKIGHNNFFFFCFLVICTLGLGPEMLGAGIPGTPSLL
jgi:hypothetical protein